MNLPSFKYLIQICELLILTCSAVVKAAVLGFPCSRTPIDAMTHVGAKVEENELSRIQLKTRRQSFNDGAELNFQFRTTSSDGILFYATHPSRLSVVSLKIVDGYLQYSFFCHIFVSEMVRQKRIDDGEWHSIVFRRVNNVGRILLDNENWYRDYSMASCGGFTSLVFGGANPEDIRLNSIRASRLTHIEGCIRNIRVSTPIRAFPKYFYVSTCD